MATIGNLAATITATTSGFSSGLDKAIKGTKDFASSMSQLPGVGTLAGAAVGAFAAIGLSALIKKAADAAVETLKLARSLGTTTDFISNLQDATKTLGGDTTGIGTALSALNKSLTDATTGGSATADVFNRLGLNAAALTKLPLAASFSQIADKIAAITDPVQRAAVAYGIFGDSAASILPLLVQGSAGLATAKKNAEAFGSSLGMVDAEKIEEANTAINRLQDGFLAAAQQIAIALAPWITELADRLKNFGTIGGASQKVISTGFLVAAAAVDVLIGVLELLKSTFAAVGTAFAYTFAFISKGFEKLFALAKLLPERFQSGFVTSAENAAKGAAEYFDSVGKQMSEYITNPFGRTSNVDDVIKFFDSVNAKAATAATSIEKVKNAGGALAEIGKKVDLFKDGFKVFNDVKTPLQGFQDSIANLNALLNAGSIGWDTYSKGVGRAVDALEKAHQLSEVKLPGAAVRGTTDAQSAIYRGQAQSQIQRENPQDRIARVLAQSQMIEQEQLNVQKQIAAALQKQPQIAMFP